MYRMFKMFKLYKMFKWYAMAESPPPTECQVHYSASALSLSCLDLSPLTADTPHLCHSSYPTYNPQLDIIKH